MIILQHVSCLIKYENAYDKYQASVRVKDKEGAEDKAEEEVDGVDVGDGVPDQDVDDQDTQVTQRQQCTMHVVPHVDEQPTEDDSQF